MTYPPCPRRKYHKFRVDADYTYEVWETCVYCGKKDVWNKDEKGRINNRLYLSAHVRDFCQPFGKTRKVYLEIYGENYKDWAKDLTHKTHYL